MQRAGKAPFEVLVEGVFTRRDVHATYDANSTMPTSAESLAWIARRWTDRAGRAKRSNIPLFNGRLFRLTDFRADADQLFLSLGNTTYREYVGTRAREFYERRQRTELANPLAVCAVIVTADNGVLVAERQRVERDVGRYHVVGGFMDRQWDGAARPDPFGAMRREILEESGLNTDPDRILCLGLVYDRGSPHPELCFTAQVELPFQEIAKAVPADSELRTVEFVSDDRTALKQFIRRNRNNLCATGQASLVLYGRYRYGRRWFPMPTR